MYNKFKTLTDYEIQQEFEKKLNSYITITLGTRSNGKTAYLESLGYKVIPHKEYKKIRWLK